MVDNGEDRAAADAAFVLEPGVPYPRRWVEAQDAVVVLCVELYRLGLVELADRVRAEVSAAGVGVVELGSVSPQTAQALAQVLAGVEVRVAGPRRPRPWVA